MKAVYYQKDCNQWRTPKCFYYLYFPDTYLLCRIETDKNVEVCLPPMREEDEGLEESSFSKVVLIDDYKHSQISTPALKRFFERLEGEIYAKKVAAILYLLSRRWTKLDSYIIPILLKLKETSGWWGWE